MRPKHMERSIHQLLNGGNAMGADLPLCAEYDPPKITTMIVLPAFGGNRFDATAALLEHLQEQKPDQTGVR